LTPVVIVGGGLSGLTAAVYLARRAIPTVIVNDANELGGRARTVDKDGFRFNFGPHRLFGRGAAVAGFRELGIRLRSAARGPNGGLAICRGRTYTLPVGQCSLMITGCLGPSAKLELARFLGDVPHVDLSALQDVTLDAWLRTRVDDRCVLLFVLALIRSATYCDEPQRMSAAAGVQQLALSLAGPVLYLHEGWGTLARTLCDDAVANGAIVRSGVSVVAIDTRSDVATQVILATGEHVECRAVILATNPRHAGQLLPGIPGTDALTPVRVASLDVALRRLPKTRSVFAFGVDIPVCFSADSMVARVAPGAGAVMHAAKYLRTAETGTSADERELEQLLDLLQPGWRALVVHRRFASTIVVSHALVCAETGGFGGRPDGRVPGIANAFLAGDWVGPTGQLADASVASALRAARATERLTATA